MISTGFLLAFFLIASTLGVGINSELFVAIKKSRKKILIKHKNICFSLTSITTSLFYSVWRKQCLLKITSSCCIILYCYQE